MILVVLVDDKIDFDGIGPTDLDINPNSELERKYIIYDTSDSHANSRSLFSQTCTGPFIEPVSNGEYGQWIKHEVMAKFHGQEVLYDDFNAPLVMIRSAKRSTELPPRDSSSSSSDSLASSNGGSI